MSCGEAVSLKPINVYNFYSMFCFCFLLLSLQLESIARARKKSENGQINSFNEFNSIQFILFSLVVSLLAYEMQFVVWNEDRRWKNNSSAITFFLSVLFMGLTKTTIRLGFWLLLLLPCFPLSIVKWSFDWHLNNSNNKSQTRKENEARKKKHHQIRLINLKQISNFTRFRWRIGQQHQQKYEKNTNTHTHQINN